jgi:hypothetical protein
VEEDPFMGDLLSVEKPCAMETTRVLAREDNFPGCIVEEIPWLGDLQATGDKKIVVAEGEAMQRELVVGIGEAMELRTAPPI